jgi:hypothetical protein
MHPKTYAQILWYSFSRSSFGRALYYQTHSTHKLLIYIENLNCLFAGQFKESLDLQGSAAACNKLSTKLSTENLDNFKTVKNQRLSDFHGRVAANARTSGHWL